MNAAHYNQADPVEQAIILGVAISQAQAFEGGNKRVAFASADSFLRLNGLVFVGPPMGLAERLVAVADPASNAVRDTGSLSLPPGYGRTPSTVTAQRRSNLKPISSHADLGQSHRGRFRSSHGLANDEAKVVPALLLTSGAVGGTIGR